MGSSAIYEIPESMLQEQPPLGSDSLLLELDSSKISSQHAKAEYDPHNTLRPARSQCW
jgi:hypothetical protein